MRRLLLLALAGLSSACATVVPVPRGEPPSRPPEDAWTRVLENFVDDQGRVDFAALSQDRRDLDRYVAWVYAAGPESRPELYRSREQVLAYHLNAYNALAMYNVIDAGIPQTNAGLGKVKFFFLRKVTVDGQRLSLRDYENDVIRKLGDARVHFALNCMSVGCPRLPREPFRATVLNEQLEREAWRFFAEPRNARQDIEKARVYLSEILDFYPEDFLAVAPSLVAYANRFREMPLSEGFDLEFTPYDWTINRQPPP